MTQKQKVTERGRKQRMWGVGDDKQQTSYVGKMPESSLILCMPIIICKITSKVGKVSCHVTGEKPSIETVS